MGILRRRAPRWKAMKPDANAASLVFERIEVTVEREWVDLLVRGKPDAVGEVDGRQKNGPEKVVLEGERLEGPAPHSDLEDRKRNLSGNKE